MSPRQARTERRAAERKAKKTEIKRLKAEAVEIGFVPQIASIAAPTRNSNRSDEPIGFVSQIPPHRLSGRTRPTHSISEARDAANRRNALHSTGPSTPHGKLASSRNSLKHGLASGELVIARRRSRRLRSPARRPPRRTSPRQSNRNFARQRVSPVLLARTARHPAAKRMLLRKWRRRKAPILIPPLRDHLQSSLPQSLNHPAEAPKRTTQNRNWVRFAAGPVRSAK